MPAPDNVKAVQRFLGKCQYYRKFILDFSVIAAPFFRLASTKEKFK